MGQKGLVEKVVRSVCISTAVSDINTVILFVFSFFHFFFVLSLRLDMCIRGVLLFFLNMGINKFRVLQI